MGEFNISLYSCLGCQKVTDNYIIQSGKYTMCACGNKRVKPVNPTKTVLVKYILGNLKHVIKLLWSEYRGLPYGA